MFTEQDIREAKPVRPLTLEDIDITEISLTNLDEGTAKQKLKPIIPAIVVLSLTLLVAAPKGTTLRLVKSALGFTTKSHTAQKDSSGAQSIEQGDINIKAHNSNVQNVNVVNNGGQVNISSRK